MQYRTREQLTDLANTPYYGDVPRRLLELVDQARQSQQATERAISLHENFDNHGHIRLLQAVNEHLARALAAAEDACVELTRG